MMAPKIYRVFTFRTHESHSYFSSLASAIEYFDMWAHIWQNDPHIVRLEWAYEEHILIDGLADSEWKLIAEDYSPEKKQ